MKMPPRSSPDLGSPNLGVHVAGSSKPLMFYRADAEREAVVMVIAEIGVNHDGNVERAQGLIRAAAEAGADAVKFQLFRPDRLLSDEAVLAGYQDGSAEDVRTLLEGLMLSRQQFIALRGVAASLGLGFLLTPFSLEDVADLKSLAVDGVKLASPDAVNTPLLEAVAELGLPMIVSTGTCDLDELGAAAEHAQRTGGALLQCVSSYPTAEADAALGGIAALHRAFPGLEVGYSDHTAAEDTGALAVLGGASVLEKHLTHDRRARGPDHAASLEPEAFKRYVTAVRRATIMLGAIGKTCLGVERDVRRVSRQSLCVAADLPRDHVLAGADLAIKRPGTGIPAARLGEVVGRRLNRPIAAGQLLREEDLA